MAKKKTVKKEQTVKGIFPLPTIGLTLWIESKRYTVKSENQVVDREGNVYKVI